MRGQPGAAFGEHDEGVEEAFAVFGSGGQVAADGAELFGSGEGAQAAGYFLSQLDHPDVAFGAVVIRWYSPVGGEAEVVIFPVRQPVGERVVLFHDVVAAGSGGGDADLDRGAEKLDLLVQGVGIGSIRTGEGLGDQLLHLDQRISGLSGPAPLEVRPGSISDGGQLT